MLKFHYLQVTLVYLLVVLILRQLSQFNTNITITNIALRRLSEWFASNRLSLNINKTNFILFCPKQKKYDNSKLKIFIDDLQIKQVTHAKFLGVQIDQNLTWNKHIDTVAINIAQNIGIIRRVKDSIPHSYLLTLYNTLILPYISSSVQHCLG